MLQNVAQNLRWTVMWVSNHSQGPLLKFIVLNRCATKCAIKHWTCQFNLWMCTKSLWLIVYLFDFLILYREIFDGVWFAVFDVVFCLMVLVSEFCSSTYTNLFSQHWFIRNFLMLANLAHKNILLDDCSFITIKTNITNMCWIQMNVIKRSMWLPSFT